MKKNSLKGILIGSIFVLSTLIPTACEVKQSDITRVPKKVVEYYPDSSRKEIILEYIYNNGKLTKIDTLYTKYINKK